MVFSGDERASSAAGRLGVFFCGGLRQGHGVSRLNGGGQDFGRLT